MLGQKYQPIHPTNIFIAALNEEEGVGATISELSENINAKRILLIDGRSQDRTVDVAKEHGAEIFFQDGKGKGDALAKAVQCMSADVAYVVITDADFTYPAEHVPEMIQILENNPHIGMFAGTGLANKQKEAPLKVGLHLGINCWLLLIVFLME
jgi:glycosyltransferase involved in cell wall biosynthesis